MIHTDELQFYQLKKKVYLSVSKKDFYTYVTALFIVRH